MDYTILAKGIALAGCAIGAGCALIAGIGPGIGEGTAKWLLMQRTSARVQGQVMSQARCSAAQIAETTGIYGFVTGSSSSIFVAPRNVHGLSSAKSFAVTDNGCPDGGRQ